jgi:hypothetical protein
MRLEQSCFVIFPSMTNKISCTLLRCQVASCHLEDIQKNHTMSCILVTNLSSVSVSWCTSAPIGYMSGSSFVAPRVVSSRNESPGLICSSTPSTATNLMQSNLSANAARISWLRNAHTIGDAQLPWPIPYKSLSNEEL